MENNIMKIHIGLFGMFLLLILNSCLMEDPLKVPFKSFTPPDLQDGWDISTPEIVNIDGDLLKDIYRYVHNDEDLWQIRSLLVFRCNKLVAESYMKDPGDREKPAAIWSCTKQFTAILTGIALGSDSETKFIVSVDDPVSKYLPQVSASQHADKANITIRNLLMMKSGIDFNNDGFKGESAQLLREEPSNSLNFILGLGMKHSPGTSYNYNDGDPQIISAIIQQQTGKTMRDWAWEVLLSKLNMKHFSWLTYKDGITMGAFGILTTPREMAKIGQLVMDDGEWKGQPLVSSTWIADMTSEQVPPSETNETGITFGYYWWKDKKRNVIFMRGHGGQYVFINPAKHLMVVITAEPNTQGDAILSLDTGLNIYDRVEGICE
jgi:CubicO group peptidase (beta-lactamase class C family)